MDYKQQIFKLIKDYFKENHKDLPNNEAPVSGKVFDEKELIYLTEATLDLWWTEGRFATKFENELKQYIGVKYSSLVNSGSSANLLAVSALSSPLIPKERRLEKNDEVITIAAGFPTTVNPIIQSNANPVFVDVNLENAGINIDLIEEAISDRTKAIILAHTLGNPADLDNLIRITKKHNLWFIEDNCDALGSEYNGRKTGQFGDISTLSFYPAHHITTGEGGAVLTNNALLHKIIRSIRDWGRDCFCPTGKDNTCGNRFGFQLGNLPYGYDHKYIYSHLGYNLKMSDMQAAIGVAQMGKLDEFVRIRRENFNYLKKRFIEEHFDNYFILPSKTTNSNPSWFGFLLIIKEKSMKRVELLKYLNERRIGTRLLFAGNIIKQPYFKNYDINYRTIGNLNNTDKLMLDAFWIGVYPALKHEHLDYIVKVLNDFFNKKMEISE